MGNQAARARRLAETIHGPPRDMSWPIDTRSRRQLNVIPSLCAIGRSSPKPGILQIACESTEEVDSVPYMGNRGFAGMNVGVDRAEKLGRDGLLWRSGFQADRGES
jgi:hypothetical protein